MQPILQFIEEFIQTEYEALVAQYSERNEDVFQAKRAKVKDFFANGLEPEIRRPEPPDDSWFTTGKQMLELNGLAPRTVFQVKAYQHPGHQTLYRAYLSSPTTPRGKGPLYFKNYFITAQDGDFKIISHYDLDVITDQEGPRLTDGGLSWILNDGEELDAIGDYEKSWKLQTPDHPAQRSEYEAE